MATQTQEQIDAEALLGRVLDGRYRLDSVLGHGGMGLVFKATQTAMGRTVAIKTLHLGLATAPQFFERFKREAEIASRLKHPNIVTIFDFGRTDDGLCYYVMEHLEGESLRQQVRRDGPMTLRRAVAIIEQVALGLGHAHKQNVIHRDMKPHNVMVTKIDQAEYVKVLDFGLVKALESDEEEQLTSTGQVLGTPQYMPPEQASGETVDARSDLYSLAAVLYYCLTGDSPFGATSVRKALTAALTQEVPTVASKRKGPPVPAAFEAFMKKAMAKEKEDRHQSVEEFIADMNQSIAKASKEALDGLPAQNPALHGKEGSGSSKQFGPEASKSGARSKPLPKSGAPSSVHVDPKYIAPGVPRASASRVDEPRPLSPVKIGIAIALLLGLIGGGAYWALKPSSGEATSHIKPPVASADPTTKPAPRPAEVEQVAVTLRTSPPGAAVLEDGAMVGRTPLERRWPKGAPRAVVFQLAGYDDLQRTYKFDSDQGVDETLVVKGGQTKPVGGKRPKNSGIEAFE